MGILEPICPVTQTVDVIDGTEKWKGFRAGCGARFHAATSLLDIDGIWCPWRGPVRESGYLLSLVDVEQLAKGHHVIRWSGVPMHMGSDKWLFLLAWALESTILEC